MLRGAQTATATTIEQDSESPASKQARQEAKRTSQNMYLPYSRTHNDFPRPPSVSDDDRFRWLNGGSLPRGGWPQSQSRGQSRGVPKLPLERRPDTSQSVRSVTSNASDVSIASLKGILS